MITLKELVDVVEGVSGKNIKTKKRNGNLPQLRYVYFELTRLFDKELKRPTLFDVGKAVNRDHATVLHGRKTFNNDYEVNHNGIREVFEECLDEVSLLLPKKKEETLKDKDVKQYYKIKHIKLQEKYRSVINKLRNRLNVSQEKLNLVNENEFFRKAINLPKDDLKELEEKFKVFIKVKESLNNKK